MRITSSSSRSSGPAASAWRKRPHPRRICHADGSSMHRDTEIVHAGFRKNTEPGTFLNGPQFSSTFTTPGQPSEHELTYGRFHNPTWSSWESALGTLEGGHAVAFASGMAGIAAVLGS